MKLNRYVNAVFAGDSKVKSESAWQYDYGLYLRIQGLSLPSAVEVHFSLQQTGGEAEPRIGLTQDGVTDVLIPESMLKNSDVTKDYKIFAWVYLSDRESGRTEYQIQIPVKSRPAPTIVDTPEDAELFREAIAAVNEAADRAETAGTAAQSWAAGGTGTREGEDADNAKYYAKKAAESARTASEKEEAVSSAETTVSKLHEEVVNLSSETSRNAENAVQSATAAENSAAAASTSEQAAIGAAERAAHSESAASESEKTATAAATTAEKSASAASSAQQKSETAQITAEKSAEAAAASERNASASETASVQSASAAAKSEKTARASAAAASESEQAATTAATQTAADRQVTETASEAAQQAATTATEAQQSILASAEQIETNKAGIETLKEDIVTKADKSSCALTDRKLDALWKLNEGISYQFEKDDEVAYQKNIPSGAKMANIKKIGGNTIVWNQRINHQSIDTVDNLKRSYDDVTLTGNIFSLTAKTGQNRVRCITDAKENHIYLAKAIVKNDGDGTIEFTHYGYGKSIQRIRGTNNSSKDFKKIYDFSKVKYTGAVIFQFYVKADEYPVSFEYKKDSFNVFDLTKMFGAGNEPSTVEEFEAMFPADYYDYNEGELMSAHINKIIKQGENLIGTAGRIEKRGNSYDNTVALPLDGNSIFIGLTPNAYFVSDNITEFSIDEGKVSLVSSASGYGIGFDFKCKGGEQYSIPDEKDMYISFYGDDRKLISYTGEKNVTVPDNAKYLVVLYRPDGAGSRTIMLKKGLSATVYVPYDKEIVQIPQALIELDGYGDSIFDTKNEVDLENKQYIQKIGKMEFNGDEVWYNCGYAVDGVQAFLLYVDTAKAQNNNVLNEKYTTVEYVKNYNGERGISLGVYNNRSVMLIRDSNYTDVNDWKSHLKQEKLIVYYELNEPILTDISGIIDSTFQNPLEVEAGGTLTFQNGNSDSYRIPVPSTEEYLVSLAEVAK